MAMLLPGWSVVEVDRHYYIYHNGFVLSVACGYAYHDPSLLALFSLLSEPCLATVLVLNGRYNVLRSGEHTNVRINGTIYLYVYNDEAQ